MLAIIADSSRNCLPKDLLSGLVAPLAFWASSICSSSVPPLLPPTLWLRWFSSFPVPVSNMLRLRALRRSRWSARLGCAHEVLGLLTSPRWRTSSTYSSCQSTTHWTRRSFRNLRVVSCRRCCPQSLPSCRNTTFRSLGARGQVVQ